MARELDERGGRPLAGRRVRLSVVNNMVFGIQTNHAMALLLGGLACLFDLRTRRIPNLLTFGGAALALGYAVAAHGLYGALTGVEGWAVGFALFMPMFLLGGMGAGDVKLLACLGAWVGPQDALWMGLYAMIAGGVMGVGVALATGYVRKAVSNIWMLLQSLAGHGRQAASGAHARQQSGVPAAVRDPDRRRRRCGHLDAMT